MLVAIILMLTLNIVLVVISYCDLMRVSYAMLLKSTHKNQNLAKSQIPNPKSQIPNPKSQIPNPKSQIYNLLALYPQSGWNLIFCVTWYEK